MDRVGGGGGNVWFLGLLGTKNYGMGNSVGLGLLIVARRVKDASGVPSEPVEGR